ncbi:hypothetical protein TWF481_001642 [Arthrobotrys musiformis]|uniref:Uncharacterized protein n=1 Tax=Arthrobotrys musiformis TaxID=47236 RepID=A0AAV9VV45_9PEZI
MASFLKTIRPPRLQPRISALPTLPPLRRPTTPSHFIYIHMLKPTVQIQIPRRAFSTPAPQKPSPGPGPNPNHGQEVSHEMPKINWRDLGASRTVKIVVIVALSIVGTMETIFYVKLFMRRFFPDEEKPVAENESVVEGSKST